MNSDADPSKRGVAPFGYLGIKACSRLPQDFRSVPRPSSPSSAKASTRCPSHTQCQRQSQSSVASSQKRTSSRRPQPPQSLAQDPSNRCQNLQTDPINSHTHTITSPKNLSAWPGITMDHKSDPGTTHRTPRLPAIDLATTTCTRAIPHAPEDATEPDSQLPKNTSTLTNS